MTIGRAEIASAHRRIAPQIRATPTIRFQTDRFGGPITVALKLELLQETGSFKARGAVNWMHMLPKGDGPVGAASGGNHGAAIAYAAGLFGRPAHIFVPETTPPLKRGRLLRYGAHVHVGGSSFEEARLRSVAWSEASNAPLAHAYDDANVVAGQGTVAAEFADDLDRMSERAATSFAANRDDAAPLDTLLVAVGGGGLIAGCSAWFGRTVRVIGVETEGTQAVTRALAAGHPVDTKISGIAADSLGASKAGEIALEVLNHNGVKTLLVSDADVRQAQRSLWEEIRVAAEPGGATAFAALLSGAYRPERGERVGVIVCGGNFDPATLALMES